MFSQQSQPLFLTLPFVSQVIFSQSSELLERESSMASSLEEVSGTAGNEPSGGAPPTDHFGVFKDFDFLEYESESIEVSFCRDFLKYFIIIGLGTFFVFVFSNCF